MAVLEITNSNFENEVLKADKPVVVDFWASWCGPCKMLSPVIEELAEEMSDIKFCKVNVDEEQELAVRFQVMSIPMLMFIKNGKVVKTKVGFQPKEAVLSWIQD